jgi:hypothetical protein
MSRGFATAVCGALISLTLSACGGPALAATSATATRGAKTRMEKTLISFAGSRDIERWSPNSDRVMGGVSTTRVTAGVSNTLVFSGRVSLENNGGFSNMTARARPTNGDDLSGYESLALRVKGDGQTYQLWLYAATRRPVWVARFETKSDEWQTIVVPFDAFIAENGFGQRVRGAGSYAPGVVRGYGFLISDKQTGPFMLELESIKAIR